MKRFFRIFFKFFFFLSWEPFISMEINVKVVFSVCFLLINLTSSTSEFLAQFSNSIDDDEFVCDCLRLIESEDADGNTTHPLYCPDYGDSNVSWASKE